MRQGLIFAAARTSALASLLTPLAVGAPRASAAPEQNPRPARASGPGVYDIAFGRFFEGFWRDAWDAAYVPGESAMTLDLGPGPVHEVAVLSGRDIVADGTFLETARLDVPPAAGPWLEMIAQDGGVELRRAVVAGILLGDGGFAAPVWALAQRVAIEAEGAAPVAVEAFTPYGTSADLETALDAAAELAALLAVPVAAGDGPPLEADPCACDRIYDAQLGGCLKRSLACQAGCAAAAIGGIAACLGAGPLAPACMALVLTAEAVCMAGCLAAQSACNDNALAAWLGCRAACEAGQ